MWSVYRSDHFNLGERALVTHWLAHRVNPGVSTDDIEETNVFYPCRDSNPESTSPQCSHYTELSRLYAESKMCEFIANNSQVTVYCVNKHAFAKWRSL
jgi:hypothetical protein